MPMPNSNIVFFCVCVSEDIRLPNVWVYPVTEGLIWTPAKCSSNDKRLLVEWLWELFIEVFKSSSIINRWYVGEWA